MKLRPWYLGFVGIIVGGCFLCRAVGAQEVSIISHEKKPIWRDTILRVTRKDGSALQGKWHLESSDALCLKLKSGREILIPKEDISEIAQCQTMTNEGFLIGATIGLVTAAVVANISQGGSGNIVDPDHLPAIATACVLSGLVGAVIGSMTKECEKIDLFDLTVRFQRETDPPGARFGMLISRRF